LVDLTPLVPLSFEGEGVRGMGYIREAKPLFNSPSEERER
jgi:hypothetical protein